MLARWWRRLMICLKNRSHARSLNNNNQENRNKEIKTICFICFFRQISKGFCFNCSFVFLFLFLYCFSINQPTIWHFEQLKQGVFCLFFFVFFFLTHLTLVFFIIFIIPHSPYHPSRPSFNFPKPLFYYYYYYCNTPHR